MKSTGSGVLRARRGAQRRVRSSSAGAGTRAAGQGRAPGDELLQRGRERLGREQGAQLHARVQRGDLLLELRARAVHAVDGHQHGGRLQQWLPCARAAPMLGAVAGALPRSTATHRSGRGAHPSRAA